MKRKRYWNRLKPIVLKSNKEMDFSSTYNNDDLKNKKQLSMYDYPNKQISYMSNNKNEESKELEFAGGSEEDDLNNINDEEDSNK